MEGVYKKRVNPTFSLFGEDRIIFKLLQRKLASRAAGFYVDVGCADPFLNSNTALFHLYGWNGIVVDPIPDNIEAFRSQRPDDIAIQALVSNELSPMPFIVDANNSELSRVGDPETGDTRDYIFVEPVSLEKLLDDCLPDPETEIDFLDVDAEDHDLQVLMSNNWQKYRPSVILVEDRHARIPKIGESETHRFLESVGYQVHSSTFLSKVYIEQNFSRF